MAQKIYLTRHGKTQANLENRFAGRSEEPICPEGRQQLLAVADTCTALELGAIYAGPLLRTKQSAAIIAEKYGLSVLEAPGLIDIDLPHWDGHTKDEIRQQFGDQYPTWLASPEQFHVDNCEDLAAVQKRAVAEVKRIAEREQGNVLLVTHLIVARCLLLHYNKQPIAKFRAIKVDNGEVVRLV
ncbi:MAG: histidine phosphatase family protein [Thermodesulfobacteriota bacterium]